MTIKRISILTTVLALASAPSAHAGDDWGNFWASATTASIELSDGFTTQSQGELRFTNTDELNYVRFSQKFYTDLEDGWKLGTNPVIEFGKKGDSWNNTYRLDLELNPKKFTLGENGPSISMRNRWELRWIEGKGSEIFHRLRQSTKATWKINAGPFKSYALANEIFYETDKSKITTNRFYPVMLSTQPGEKLKISYYLLYQSKRTGITSDWSGAFILGTSLSL